MNDNGCGGWNVISKSEKLVTMGTNTNAKQEKSKEYIPKL